MKFKNYAPALLASGIVGFVLGIGAFSFYMNKPFKDMGSLPDWIGALTTIVAGVWAYTRFRKETAEKIINQPIVLEWNIREWRIKDPDNPDSGKYINAYLINVHNPTERPIHIKSGYLSVASPKEENANKVYLELNLHKGSYNLGFDDYAEFSVSRDYIGNVVEQSFYMESDELDDEFFLLPSVVLSNDQSVFADETVAKHVFAYEII